MTELENWNRRESQMCEGLLMWNQIIFFSAEIPANSW